MINHLILASKSPQRKRILNDMGISFKAVPSEIDENPGSLKKPSDIAKYIALKKAEKIAPDFPHEWVLGCDTFVILSNGEMSLKPRDRADARRTINLYRNSHCDVYSGLALVNKSLNKKFVHYEKTIIYFNDFSDEEMEKYLNTDDWKGRSGSMTIEGNKWVKKIKGDYWNVVGLPVELLKDFLRKIG
jgi:septum formation protein